MDLVSEKNNNNLYPVTGKAQLINEVVNGWYLLIAHTCPLEAPNTLDGAATRGSARGAARTCCLLAGEERRVGPLVALRCAWARLAHHSASFLVPNWFVTELNWNS